MSQNLCHNTNAFNTVNNFTVADHRSNILAWLSPLEPSLRHQGICEGRVEDVGEWLLETEEFTSWYAGSGESESDSRVLFCYGDPGVGKTFISSLVIDRLCDRAGGQNVAVGCFYFDFAAQKEQTPVRVLGALLKQVVSGLEKVPEEIAQAYEDQQRVLGGRAPQLAKIVKMLEITSSEKRTFICMDALDECLPGFRVDLLDLLNEVLQKCPGTRIFVTGRPQIIPEIRRRLRERVACLSISPKRDDIIGYLRNRLKKDTNPEAMDSRLEADILKKIPNDISEIFLLVSLNIEAILQETTISRRRKKLGGMTDGLGLGDVYGATLSRIMGQGGDKARLGMATLMWISHSERPLKADELCQALAVEIGSPDLDPDNVPSIGLLLACCQGLVALDKGDSTVRFIHFTVQEYLQVHPDLFGSPHSTIAETCLSFLNSQQVEALSASSSSGREIMPFLEYSSLYWGTHAQRELSDCAKLLALKLFGDFNNHISGTILLKAQGPYTRFAQLDKPYVFGGLHCASIFGIAEIVAGLIEAEGCDINQTDIVGNTPLLWAAYKGHEGVVKLLLGRADVNPDKPDNYGTTPLCFAANRGHEGVVKILLGRADVNPDNPDNYIGTPLCTAAWFGHEGVVKILLGRADVNPDKPDNSGETPLRKAAYKGHEGVVKLLLGRADVNPDKPNNRGTTPLCSAAEQGHEGVVKILLGRADVNPDKPDNYSGTPLCRAAWFGHEGVVKLLLGRADINPDKPFNSGETPLCRAAYKGHEGVVKLLLGRADVNPDKPDNRGTTPLCSAAEQGHEGVVKILLGRADVNPDKPDIFGKTPLWYASEFGHAGVIALL